MNRLGLALLLSVGGWVGCGGKLDYTDSDQTPDGQGSGTDDAGSADGASDSSSRDDESPDSGHTPGNMDSGNSDSDGGSGQSYADPGCPPQQWDCSEVEVSCRIWDNSSVFAPQAACRCDSSRPLSVADCGKDQDLLCGRLDASKPGGGPIEVGCRCVSSYGYYCAECSHLGLNSPGTSLKKCGGHEKHVGFCDCAE